MEHLIYFVVVFILVNLIYLLFLNKRRLKKNKVKDMGEVVYIVNKFKLDTKKMDMKKVVYTIGILNAFIIAFVCMIVAAIPLQMILKMAIGFVLLFGLIYSIYEIYGRYLVSKGWSKK